MNQYLTEQVLGGRKIGELATLITFRCSITVCFPMMDVLFFTMISHRAKDLTMSIIADKDFLDAHLLSLWQFTMECMFLVGST